MTDQHIEGLRKAARRTFWEAKNLDSKLNGARDAAFDHVITLLERFRQLDSQLAFKHGLDVGLFPQDIEGSSDGGLIDFFTIRSNMIEEIKGVIEDVRSGHSVDVAVDNNSHWHIRDHISRQFTFVKQEYGIDQQLLVDKRTEEVRLNSSCPDFWRWHYDLEERANSQAHIVDLLAKGWEISDFYKVACE